MRQLQSWIKKDGALWFLYFIVFAVIGWIYETCLVLFEYHEEFYNRGVLWGPYLPIYGFGGLIIIASMRRLRDRKLMAGRINLTPLALFALVVLVTTVVELIGSYIMEWTIGEWLWDYSDYHPNFEGRISLNSSLRFGLMGIVGLYVIYPLLTRLHAKATGKLAYKIIMLIVALAFLSDVVARLFVGSNY